MIGSSKVVLGLAVLISAVASIIDACPESSVNLYLYNSKTGKDKPCKLTTSSCPDIKTCGFDPNSRTVVVIHGWAGSYTGENPGVIKNAYVDKMSQDGTLFNVILVDYGPCSSNYLSAVTWIKQIAGAAAKIVQYLVNSCGLNIKLIECIGFSLGAHICGVFSIQLTTKCHRIVGLDTAAPLIPSDVRLDPSKAGYVFCYHTSTVLAITSPIGHCDMYLNGAQNQPGCDGAMYGPGCDHNAACRLYALSILYPRIFSSHKQCDTSDQALKSQCTKPPSTVGHMGDDQHGVHGIFWANTHECLKQYNLA